MTRRILLSYLTVTFVVLVILEVPLGIFYAQREEERLANDIQGDASVLAMAYEDALEHGTGLDPTAAQRYGERTGARVVVTDAAGTSLVDTDGEVPRDLSTRPELAEALAGRRSSGSRRSETLGTDLLYVAVPVGSGSSILGAVRVTFDRHEVTERIRRFWAGLLLVAVAVLGAVAGLGWTIARWVTRPLRRLESAATRFAVGDLRVEEVDPDAPPEVAVLWRTLNDMAARLGRLMAEQRSFVADASHQLRTPLTALRLRLENLEQAARAGEVDLADLDAATLETERLAALVEDLLRLARAEQPLQARPTDLGEVVTQRLDTWGAVADAQGISLHPELPDPPPWGLVVPSGLEQVLDNLLDNALRVAPPGSQVRVRVRHDGRWALLEVADRGPGLDTFSKAAALERFRHGPDSHGSGLGLPIASALVEASGGRLDLCDEEGGGLRVEVRVPLVAPAPT
jgi:signal transduction histidine kinase